MQTLVGIDKSWMLEHHFWVGMVGAVGEDVLSKKLLACLPEGGRPLELDASIGAVNLLEKSKLFSFVGVTSQATLCKVMEWLMSLRGKRQPRFGTNQTAFLNTVQMRLGFFCKHGTTAGSSGDGVWYGRLAVEKYFKEASEAVTSGNATLTHLQPLQIYGWLLLPDEADTVHKFTMEIFKGVAVEPSATPAAKSKASKATSKQEKHTADKQKSTISFFA